MYELSLRKAAYAAVKERVQATQPEIDEQTLADTVEGLTELPDIIVAIIRSALEDEALANGLKGRMAEMQERSERLKDRASKRRANHRLHATRAAEKCG